MLRCVGVVALSSREGAHPSRVGKFSVFDDSGTISHGERDNAKYYSVNRILFMKSLDGGAGHLYGSKRTGGGILTF